MSAHSKENTFLVAALAATHAGAFECHVPERTVTISANLEALLGFSPGGFDGRIDSLLEILNPQDRERIVNQVRNSPPDKTQIETEFRIIEPEGHARWFYVRGELEAQCHRRGDRPYRHGPGSPGGGSYRAPHAISAGHPV